jgi:biphenyl-2,3-diol 1,2-dioxygenase
MRNDEQVAIAYAAIEVRRPDRWQRFLDAITGGEARVDWNAARRARALRITEGPRDDLVALGLAWQDEAAYRGALARIATTGAMLQTIAAEGAARAMRCADPAGNVLDLLLTEVAEPGDGSWPIGHVALASPQPEPLVDFYEAAVGLRLNERMRGRVGPLDLRGGFLGSPARHHSLAVLNVPGRRRLHHIEFEAAEVADVVEMRARAKAAKVPISLELGRHALPDGTVSFYAHTPSGFEIEVGAGMGAGAEGPAPEGPMPSVWGHELTLPARLRVMGALALQKAGL